MSFKLKLSMGMSIINMKPFATIILVLPHLKNQS